MLIIFLISFECSNIKPYCITVRGLMGIALDFIPHLLNITKNGLQPKLQPINFIGEP